MRLASKLENFAARTLLDLFCLQKQSACLTTLMFHKIPKKTDLLVPDELNIDQFEHILDFLRKYTTPLHLSEAVSRLRTGNLPKRSVVITFDDGYPEWQSNIAPLLLKNNIPATFFVTSETLNGQQLWHERIVDAVRALPVHGAKLPYGFGGFVDVLDERKRVILIKDLQGRLKYLPLEERLAAIVEVENQRVTPLPEQKVFDVEMLRRLRNQGFDIGAHTVRHPILNECGDAEAIREIGQSKEIIESILGEKITAFAYPNGRPGKDYSYKHVQAVIKCGFQVAFSSTAGVATKDSDFFQLPRTTLWPERRLRMSYHFFQNYYRKTMSVPPSAGFETNKNIRCLLVASTFPPIHGGSAVVYDNVCRNLPFNSIRVLAASNNYLTQKAINGCKEYDANAPFPIDRLPYLRPLMLPPPRNIFVSVYRFIVKDLMLYLHVFVSASQIVRKHNINIVCIGELVSGGWLGVALKKCFGCKLVFYVHGEEITTNTQGRLYGRMRRRYLEAADKVVSVSSFTCDALTKRMSVPPNSIALIENGVDTERFTPGPVDLTVLSALGLKGKRILLFVGRLVQRKGVDMVISSMPEIIKKIPNIHFVIVGDGEYRETLHKQIADMEMNGYISMVGKVSDDDLVKYFRACDLFVMPNRTMPDGDTEGFGLVFREANACGKPVIAGRAGGAVEAVIEGQTGLLVDGENVKEISDSIIKILSTPQLAADLSEGGLDVARENNVQAMASKFQNVCLKLIQ